MIEKKPLHVPVCTCKKVRYAARQLEELYNVDYRHIQYDGQGMICAEGFEIAYESISGDDFFAVRDKVFSYTKSNLRLTDLETNAVWNQIPDVLGILAYESGEGQAYYIAYGKGFAYRLKEAGNLETLVSGVQCTCGAILSDRLFLGAGSKIYFSDALNLNPILPCERRKSGFFEFLSDCGDIIGMTADDGRLYAFHRYGGVTRLRVTGDPLNYSADTVKFSCGEIYEKSIVNCGNGVYFLTADGLYSFNGETCRLVKKGIDKISDTETISACAWRGRYYATWDNLHGKAFCYVPETDKVHYAFCGAKKLFSGYRMYEATSDTSPYVLRVTPKGEGVTSNSSMMTVERMDFGDQDSGKIFDAILLEGEGDDVAIWFIDDNSRSTRMTVPFGTLVPLNPAIRSKRLSARFTLTPTSRFDAVTYYYREVRQWKLTS